MLNNFVSQIPNCFVLSLENTMTVFERPLQKKKIKTFPLKAWTEWNIPSVDTAMLVVVVGPRIQV